MSNAGADLLESSSAPYYVEEGHCTPRALTFLQSCQSDAEIHGGVYKCWGT